MKKIFFITIIFIALAILLNWHTQWYIIPTVFLTIFAIHPQAFHLFLKWKFILFILLLLVGIPLLLGEKNATFWGIRYSYEYFQKSLIMVNRSLIILLSIRMFTGKIAPEQLSIWLKKVHLRNFSDVLSVSMGVLPELKTITKESYHQSQNSITNDHFLKKIFNGIVRLLVKILNFADQYYQEQTFQQSNEQLENDKVDP
jgi:hypothetical protein